MVSSSAAASLTPTRDSRTITASPGVTSNTARYAESSDLTPRRLRIEKSLIGERSGDALLAALVGAVIETLAHSGLEFRDRLFDGFELGCGVAHTHTRLAHDHRFAWRHLEYGQVCRVFRPLQAPANACFVVAERLQRRLDLLLGARKKPAHLGAGHLSVFVLAQFEIAARRFQHLT